MAVIEFELVTRDFFSPLLQKSHQLLRNATAEEADACWGSWMSEAAFPVVGNVEVWDMRVPRWM